MQNQTDFIAPCAQSKEVISNERLSINPIEKQYSTKYVEKKKLFGSYNGGELLQAVKKEDYNGKQFDTFDQLEK